MAKYRRICSELFGNDGFSEDEETIREQQLWKQKLKDAFGSDSELEEQNEQWSDTSISECEKDHSEDMVELTCSDIEEDMSNLLVGKLYAEPIKYDEIKHDKELAQFQRQISDRINKRNYEEEIGQYGIKIFQQVEDILKTKSLIAATIASIPSEPAEFMDSSIQPRDNNKIETVPKQIHRHY